MVPAGSPAQALPLMDELLQSSALRHQLGEAASQHHEGQDGQEVIGATVGQRHAGPRLWGPVGLFNPQTTKPSSAPGVVLHLLLLSLRPSTQSTLEQLGHPQTSPMGADGAALTS